MYAVSASGGRLAPYVVYKAQRLQATWVRGGRRDYLYNNTPSGWFDSKTFQDWFTKVALPYLNNFNGPKVIIGDNVPFHINIEVIRAAEANDIKFVFLPPNTTHFLQPLDVAVFRTLKLEWRKCLADWKTNEGRRLSVLPKWAVPQLLSRLEAAMSSKWVRLAKAGFSACGIYPINPHKVLSKHFDADRGSDVSQTLINYLEARREASAVEGRGRGRRRRLQVPSGQAVTVADLERAEAAAEAAAAVAAAQRGRGRGRGRARGSSRGRGRGSPSGTQEPGDSRQNQ